MFGSNSRLPSAIALGGSLLGLLFAAYSTFDYAAHLDRKLHDVHCSFIPGAPATADAEACRAAMYSPYAAFMRDAYWGGIPISLFAVGAFTFFAGFALYLLIAGGSAPKKAVGFFAVASVSPLLASLVMFTISVMMLGTLCKTCVGMYIAAALLAAGGLLGLLTLRQRAANPRADAGARPVISVLFPVAWLASLALITFIPAAVYAGTIPDHSPYLSKCGEIKKPAKPHDTLLRFKTERSVRPALLFEDPLCPTCKAFHQRVKAEGIWERLDIELALFPLDSACNWMLDAPLHPGACTVSKAVLCGKQQALGVLEWSYEEQDYLTRAGKAGEGVLRAAIQQRWGPGMIQCIDDVQTKAQLNRHLQLAVDNSIPVSTPQMYLGKQRICDEDTDIGLRFTLGKLAPEVFK
jgi:uncharacterized membrane protein